MIIPANHRALKGDRIADPMRGIQPAAGKIGRHVQTGGAETIYLVLEILCQRPLKIFLAGIWLASKRLDGRYLRREKTDPAFVLDTVPKLFRPTDAL